MVFKLGLTVNTILLKDFEIYGWETAFGNVLRIISLLMNAL